MGTGRSLGRLGVVGLGAALAAGASLALGGAPAGSSTPKPTAATTGERRAFDFGFTDVPVPITRHVGWVKHARASVARVTVHIWVIDYMGWELIDHAYHALRGNGIRPIMTLSGDKQSGDRLHAMEADEFRALVGELARRYPGAAIQVLNETNTTAFGRRLSPEEYARKLKQAERAIRRVRPRARVIASAASPTWGRANPHVYTRRVFDNIAPRRRIHAAANIFPQGGERPVAQAVRSFRRIRRASGGRPTWVTEVGLRADWGWGAGARRARHSARVLRALGRRGARGVTFHRLVNDSPFMMYGALDEHGNPTPLYWALRRAAPRR